MNILQNLKSYAETRPEQIAMVCDSVKITYKELWDYSDLVADYLLATYPESHDPIAVYGHKDPWMLVSFLGCVKAGHAYCPIDISVPENRVAQIVAVLPSSCILAVEPIQALTAGEKEIIDKATLESLVSKERIQRTNRINSPECWVTGDQTYYIIFTSGSTGTPKGVQITADCLNHYLDWSVELGTTEEQKAGKVFLNQAPFSFDLSVMDLYTSLAVGGTLWCLNKSTQSDFKKLKLSLESSEVAVWVSTPSFAEICMTEPSFDQEHLKELALFLFCGETLTNKTAAKLQKRFPKAKIMNTYGPTESTVAVTEVEVTAQLNEAENPLPVGKAKPGTRIEIWDENGKQVPEGEKGEIIIIGNTVSTGYYCSEEQTAKAFFIADAVTKTRGYHTGDEGYLKQGMLYYSGRIDLQIKLHGYRIELEDIESNLCKVPEISQAVVVPNMRMGKVSSLTAYVVSSMSAMLSEKERKQQVKEALAAFLPDYMIPKNFVFLEQMPMTANGKADRKALLQGKSTGGSTS